MGRRGNKLPSQNVEENKKAKYIAKKNSKKSTLNAKPVHDYMFVLKKILPYSTLSKDVTLEFPLVEHKAGLTKCAIPTPRRDRLSYTPLFCLPDEFNQKYENQQKQLHENRIRTDTFDNSYAQILVPKPTQRNSYCMTCRQRFQDYLEHLSQSKHIRQTVKSPFRNIILEMCEKKKMEREYFSAKDNNNQREDTLDCSSLKQEIFVQQAAKGIQLLPKEQLYFMLRKQCMGNKSEQQSIFGVLI